MCYCMAAWAAAFCDVTLCYTVEALTVLALEYCQLQQSWHLST